MFNVAVTNLGRSQDMGPPERVICLGEMAHTCQEDLVMKVTQTDVPYFNAPIYLENKEQVPLPSILWRIFLHCHFLHFGQKYWENIFS
jgi:hypothetical protein